MKNSIYIIIALTLVMFQSCKKDFVEGYDVDPNRPLDVSMDVLSSSAQAYSSWVTSSDLTRLTGVITQQMTGEDRQFLAINRYVIAGSDVETVWEVNAYAGGLKDLSLLMEKADEQTSPHYKGVAQILTASNLGTLTDCFGDIPYSEALAGTISDGLEPTYDSQAKIYDAIFQLLDDGIANVSATSSTLSPGGDDLYLGGDLTQWAKYANSLKARHYNRLSNTGDYDTEIMNAIAAGFGAGEGATPLFETAKPQSNPWYQFLVVDRAGYIGLNGYMFDNMTANNDTLRTAAFGLGGWYFQPESPIILVHGCEMLFIEAETMLRTGAADADVQAKLEEAVTSHFGMIALDASDYLANDLVDLASLASEAEKLEAIMWEKYVASYTTNEAWSDYRRTGYPVLTAVADAQGGIDVPQRLPYPQSEFLYNSNTPASLEGFPANLTTSLWWAE